MSPFLSLNLGKGFPLRLLLQKEEEIKHTKRAAPQALCRSGQCGWWAAAAGVGKSANEAK